MNKQTVGYLNPIELRKDDSGREIVEGYAAVFYDPEDREGTTYDTYEGEERIARSAFNNTLESRDEVYALYNHDTAAVLGKRSTGTLRLSVDGRGLRFAITLADTTRAADLAADIRAGNIDGASFGFRVRDCKKGKGVREIRDVELIEVSPCAIPAYSATSVGMRYALRSLDLDVPPELLAEARRRKVHVQVLLDEQRLGKIC